MPVQLQLDKGTKDNEKEQKEDKPKELFHGANDQTKTYHDQDMDIEPIRFIAQDNLNDDEDVTYVKTDSIAITKPSQPIPFGSKNTNSVLQQRSMQGRNIHDTGAPKTLKLMPVYSKSNQKEKEPPKMTKKRNNPPSTKPSTERRVSNTEREQIVAKYESGMELKTISDMLNIPKHSVNNVLLKYKKTGEATIPSRVKDPQIPLDVMLSIQLWMKDDCNVTLTQLAEKVWTTYSMRVSKDSIARSLIGFNYFFNRVHTFPKQRSKNTSPEQIKEYAASFSAVPESVSKAGIIFLDVAALNVTFKANTKERLQHKCFYILCAMNESGVLHYRSQPANISNDAATNFVNVLKVKLRALHIEESVVVIGNAANQRYSKLQDTIGYYKCNAMFMPTNAAYLNPVQYLFKNFKTIIRRANPLTVDGLMQAVESVPSLIGEHDCQNWFELMWSYVPRCVEGETMDDFDVQD
uniref:Tc1-like transposase DDE domain-containing protein n=1 Tax=Anopheles culicifacies TaxID=139723 RepID=A0A182MQY8_9DIPT